MRHAKVFKAFTLIELLIVVAIIAILAAIAVPNFLEAQIRAKVSRARADMRACGVALEAYAVDERTYPFAIDPGIEMTPNSQNPPQYFNYGVLPQVLSTPVAYITSMPIDPFMFYFKHGIGGQTAWYATPGSPFTRFGYTTKRLFPGPTQYENGETQWLNGVWIPGMRNLGQNIETPWIQFSPGPASVSFIYVWLAYDPSNGTVSPGAIVTYAGSGSH